LVTVTTATLASADGILKPNGVGASVSRVMGEVEDVYGRCRELGMRLSRQRRMVLDLLWKEKSHLSARDIFEKLNDQGRNIGHTSVYQNLEALQSAGVIECLDRANGRLYGYRADPHSHLTCMESGEILDLDVALPPDLLHQIEQSTGFAIESYTLHLSGRRRGPDGLALEKTCRLR
jgi:Fur family ferric uptake transcriptional regulator